MFSCFICKESFLLISELCKHFKIKHVIHDFKEHTCVELNFNRSLHLLNSFKKHLASHFTVALIPTVIDKSNIVTSVDINLCPYKNSKSSTNPFHCNKIK